MNALDKWGKLIYIFPMIGRIVSGLVLLALSSTPALAQQQVITQFGNGYAVGAPGQPPVLVQPFGNGGYTIAQPGQPPAIVQPFGANTWIVTPPLSGPIAPIAPIPPIPGM